MLGAIIGDIAGSCFEFENYKGKDFELFHKDCCYTDDTVMTLAVCRAILDCAGDYTDLSKAAIRAMQKIGRKHPNCGFGEHFGFWIQSKDPQPYDSYGNGAAMRVSACGYAAKSIEEVKNLSYKVTCVSHSHKEGLKGAEATAVCVFLARTGKSIEEIKNYVKENYYAIDFTLDQIRRDYYFEISCQQTVPQALEAFFESTSFEDAVRNAISIGGDSDTIGAITGAVAGAFYGVPEELQNKALAFLDNDLKKILKDFEAHFPTKTVFSL